MKLAALVATAQRLAETGGRLDKIATLADLLAAAPVEDRGLLVSFLSGELPDGRLGVGPKQVYAASRIDATDAARELELSEIGSSFAAIRGASGAGSAQKRRELLEGLFARASSEERDFLARLLLGELRQGALEGLMVEALGRASGIEADKLRRALMLSGNLQAVAGAALANDLEAIEAMRVEVFRPVQPMLAQPAGDLDQAWGRLNGGASDGAPANDPGGARLALELKIDGARVQVHRRDGEVRIYSRALNEVTESVPEIVELVSALPVRELILDGEAYAHRNDVPLPFQVTMRRFGRRLDVAEQRRALPLRARFFDCLLVDGEELIDRPLRERWHRLDQLLPPTAVVDRELPDSLGAARRFLRRALEAGHEGVMAKAVDSPYQAGSRGFSWLKIKPVHTLDLVVIAVEWGSGRRRGWLSNLHLAARDEKGEHGPAGGFVMLGKTFKGLTDQLLQWQTERFLELETARSRHVVQVRPELVVEIAFNNIQASPQYPSGMALRFARVKRYRPDKTAADASTVSEVRAIFDQEGMPD